MSDTFPEEVKKEYIDQCRKFDEKAPARCPYCKSEKTCGWQFEEFIGTDEVKVSVSCGGCDRYWFEYYSLSEIEPGSPWEGGEEG